MSRERMACDCGMCSAKPCTCGEEYRRPRVELAECVHCGCYTLNPESDMCACGKELYPVTKVVDPGTRITGECLEILKVEKRAG